jgi:hypothetical protein
MLAVRQSSPANLSGTNGDYEPLQVNAGRLWVSATIDAALPTGSNVIGALSANQSVNLAQVAGGATSTVATGVQKVGIADSAGTAFLSAANALNSTGGGVQAVQIVGQFDDTTPTSITENQFGNIRMSANRNLYGTIRDAGGNERGANVNASNQLSVSVDNTVTVASHAVTNAGTFAVQESGAALTALQLIDNIVQTEDTASANGDSGVVIFAVRKATPANTSGTDGDYEALQISAGRLWCSATIDAALPAGTNAIGKLAANSGIDIGDVDVTSIIPGTAAANLGKAEDAAHTTGDTGVFCLGIRNDSNSTLAGTDLDYTGISTDLAGNPRCVGNRDHDATDAGSPVKVGGKGFDLTPSSSGTEPGPSNVAANDRTDLMTGLKGELPTVPAAVFYTLSNVSTDYDTAAETATSQNIDCWRYRRCTVGFTLSSTGTPTDIQFIVEISLDGTNYFEMKNGALGQWIYDDTYVATARNIAFTFDIACRNIRLKVVSAGGSSGSVKFTVSNAAMYLQS